MSRVPGASPAPASWPFVGRTAELDAVRAALLAPAGRGVVVAGATGVGKTRLAARVAGGLDARRYDVVRTKATEAAAWIPYGAFAHLLPALNPPRSPRAAAEAVERALRAGGGSGPLVLAVDDAHSLDPASTSLVGALVTRSGARLLATVRAGEETPEQLAALWRGGGVRELELGPLPYAETATLLESAVGGQVEAAAARRLWRIAEGNPLFLRELVLAGALVLARPGVWRCPPDTPVTPRLRELLERRIGTVDGAEREALEFLALGEPLGEDLLRGLTGGRAVGRLTERGLVTAAGDGERRWLRLAHPLYGEVVRAGTGQFRTGTRLRRLAEATETTGLRRREDVLRVAAWRLDSGGPADPELLLRAGRYAWAGLDLDLAARLGRAALRAGGGGPAAAMLGTVLHFAGRDAEAEAALAEVAGRLSTDQERAEHAVVRGMILAWGLGRDQDADGVLAGAAAAVGGARRRHVLAVKAWIDLFAGRPDDARQALNASPGPAAAERGSATAAGPTPIDAAAASRPTPINAEAASTPTPVHPTAAAGPTPVDAEASSGSTPVDAGAAAVAAEVAAAEVLVDAYGGRPLRALATAGRALAEAGRWRDEVPVVLAALAHGRTVANLFAGDLPGALERAREGLALVHEFGEWPRVAASFSGWRAQAHRLRGELGEAMRWARNGAAALGDRPAPFAGLCFGELAAAAAQLGQAAVAEEALDRAAELSRPAWYGVDFSARLARPWVLAARGQAAGAVGAALAAADDARRHGLAGYEMLALHDAVRLAGTGDRAGVAGRLARLAGGAAGPLPALLAEHAAAAAARDGAGLDRASAGFAELGMLLHAAEAAAQASAAYGQGRAAAASARRSRTLSERCPGARTPPLAPLAIPLLTPRQRQIAQLAAQGLGNREIAERLAISYRTVGNHLVTIYERLGVTDRSGLAAHLAGRAVSPGPPAAPTARPDR